MNEVILWMSVAYVFLLALLLLVLTYSQLAFKFKLGLILLASCFYWLSYSTWQDVQGWPSASELPKRFLLHYAVVEEPSDKTGTKGRVFIFATDITSNRPADTPRAYSLPYGKDLHAKVDASMRKIRNGNLQLGQVGGELFDPTEARDNTRIAEKKSELQFVDLPDPQLPEK